MKQLYIFSEITNETAESFIRELNDTEGDVEVLLNSPGGSLDPGWAMIGAMSSREVQITVMGAASSMAFVMLLFANKVVALDTASFLVHRAASWAEEYMNEEQLTEVANRNKIIRKKMESRINPELFAEITGKSFDEIFDMADRRDVFLNANQMKKIGLVDKIVKINPKQRAAIESNYIHSLAASYTETSINTKTNNMGLFDKKKPLKIAVIGDQSIGYRELEIGKEVEIIGKDEAYSGTFAVENQTFHVAEGKITAIEKTNMEMNAIKSELSEIKAFIAELHTEFSQALDEVRKENDTLKASFAAAKIVKSNPVIPKGEFKQEEAKGEDFMTVREKLQAMQNKMAEELKRKKEGSL